MNLARSKPTFFLATAKARAARRFYSRTLDLPLLLEDRYALVYRLRDVELRISKLPKHTPMPFTVLDLEVSDIEEAHKRLAARGVKFILFENMKQDTRGVWQSADGATKLLWFKDPDGNVLSVSERG